MTYAAEPYAQFVDDLLIGLTGGVTRERFVFLDENRPFRLSPPGAIYAGSLQVFGQAEGAFFRFRSGVDFTLEADEVVWRAASGKPAPGAVWPDLGAAFYVNYDYRAPSGVGPLLSDRNVGSVTRLFAESFGREFAILSQQLESVYRAGFIDTATGRDLEQLVALVGVRRRSSGVATGSVVFSCTTPSPADVFIPAGARLSTAEPPLVAFETTEDRTLHRGSLTVDVPIAALESGMAGVVGSNAVRVIHRPLLGIESATNPQPTILGGADESDELLRARAKRALDAGGKATVGALLGELAALPGVRQKDIRIDEDYVKRPGVISVAVAAALAPVDLARAVDMIEATRPAGIRVLHNFDVPAGLGLVTPSENERDAGDGAPGDSVTATDQLFFPVGVRAVVLPSSGNLSPQDRVTLATEVRDAILSFVADAGIGETLIYNRLVARIVCVEGVLDTAVDLFGADSTESRRRNLDVPRTLRPSLSTEHGGRLVVEVGGELVAFDVAAQIELKGLALDPGIETPVALELARLEIFAELTDKIETQTQVTPVSLAGLVTDSEHFKVKSVAYDVEYLDAGVRVKQKNKTIQLDELQRPWIRKITVST